ncbi:MAG: hypothetical protein ACRBF0_08295 [Calditrichia bacterium]
MIQEIFLKMTWPNWIFVLSVLALAVVSYLFYFRTLPPLSTKRRIPGFLLRALSLGLVLFLILEPVMQLLYRSREKPVIAVLYDNSASMKISESYGSRFDSLNFIMQNVDAIFPNDSVEIRPYRFDLNLRSFTGGEDSLDFAVDGSNLARAIASVSDSLSTTNLQGIVVVSDGVYNQGVNPVLPARQRATPVHTVLVGDARQPNDIAITRVQSNNVTYVGKKLPVEIVFSQSGYDGKRALLSIARNGKRVAQKQITLGNSGFEQKEILEIVSTEAGDFTYSVSMQTLADEKTEKNNRKLLRVQVLKSRINVLVMSGGADFDRRFLSFAGDKLKDFNFAFRTEVNSSQYFEGRFTQALLDTQDLILMHGFPSRLSDAAHVQQLTTLIRSKKKPVFWMFNRRNDVAKLKALEDMLPFTVDKGIRPIQEQIVGLTPAGRLHPAAKLSESEGINDLLWQELPPVEYYSGVSPSNGAQVLLSVNSSASGKPKPAPAYFSYRQNEIKQLVFAASNIANWHFRLQEDPSRNEFFVNWLERSMRWLVNRDDINQVQVRPLQDVYNVGEAVTLSGSVYDEFYEQIPDADVVATVQNDTVKQTDEFIAQGNGFYSQSFSGLPQGDYRYTVRATRNGRNIGSRSGKFSVKPFYLEFQQISANKSLMEQLALETQGKSYTPDSFIKTFADNKVESRLQISFDEMFLWNYWQWLVALITLLGIEWFLRKRWGLL